MIATTYSVNNFNYNHVFLAVIASVVAHIIFVGIYLNKGNAPIYIDNGIQAFDRPRISLSLSAMKPVKKTVPKIEEANPIPAEVQKEEAAKVTEEFAYDTKTQEAIPVVENATFKGERSPPLYPKRALMLKQEGVVLLKVLVGINGGINDIQIITSSGYTILDKSAINAVRKWKFEPSNINGKPSLSWVKVPVEFVIK